MAGQLLVVELLGLGKPILVIFDSYKAYRLTTGWWSDTGTTAGTAGRCIGHSAQMLDPAGMEICDGLAKTVHRGLDLLGISQQAIVVLIEGRRYYYITVGVDHTAIQAYKNRVTGHIPVLAFGIKAHSSSGGIDSLVFALISLYQRFFLLASLIALVQIVFVDKPCAA